MKLTFLRKKKGQIQGVDFALAMIVFMIIFAEVIVLSLSFLQPKYLNLEDRAFETRVDQVSDAFFSSTGYPSYWEYNYSKQFNSFGLRKVGSTDLDANKISRINSQALYSLGYKSLINNFSITRDFGFQLYLDSVFEINGTLTLTQPNTRIDVVCSVGDCDVWIYLILPDNSIAFSTSGVTDASGEFSDTFNIGMGTLPNGYYTLVSFARSSKGHYAMDIDNVIVGLESNLGIKFLVQENLASSGLATINSQNFGSLSTLSAIILYPFRTGEEALGYDTHTIVTPNSEEIFNLRLPTNGSCVVLLTGETASGAFSRKQFIYPSMLTENFGTVFGADELPEQIELTKIEELVTIRECIFKAVLFVWPE